MTTDDFRKAQLRLGLTNAAMADLLRVSVSYVEMLRGGKRSASDRLQRVIEQAEELKSLKAPCVSPGHTENKTFEVGGFVLLREPDGGIWIGDGTGEGGVFSEQELGAVIGKFYYDNL